MALPHLSFLEPRYSNPTHIPRISSSCAFYISGVISHCSAQPGLQTAASPSPPIEEWQPRIHLRRTPCSADSPRATWTVLDAFWIRTTSLLIASPNLTGVKGLPQLTRHKHQIPRPLHLSRHQYHLQTIYLSNMHATKARKRRV